jgi:hypothetical protein
MAATDTTRRNSLLDASKLAHVPSTTRRPANISRTSSTSIRSLKYTLDYPARPSCSQLLAENATLKRELVQRHAQIRQLSTQNKTFRSMLDFHSAHIGSESSNTPLLSSMKLNFIVRYFNLIVRSRLLTSRHQTHPEHQRDRLSLRMPRHSAQRNEHSPEQDPSSPTRA